MKRNDLIRKYLREGTQYYPGLFCKCGCKSKIPVRTNHLTHGIPRYVRGHNSLVVKGHRLQPKQIRKKISKTLVRKYEKGIIQHSSGFGGHHHTEESKAKISRALMGHQCWNQYKKVRF